MKRRRFLRFGATVPAAVAMASVAAGPVSLLGSRLAGPLEIARRTLPPLANRASIYTGEGWRYIATRAYLQMGPHRGQRGIAAWHQGPQGQIRNYVEGLR